MSSNNEINVNKSEEDNKSDVYDNGEVGKLNVSHKIISLALSYHKSTLLVLVLVNILAFHLDKLVFNLLLVVLFCLGWILFYKYSNNHLKDELDVYLKSSRQKCLYSAGFIKVDWYVESSFGAVQLDNTSLNQSGYSSNSNSLNRSKIQFDQKSYLGIKPSLTGSYAIDDELHSIIELVIRDYIDSWYKTSISSKEEFGQSIRVLIYNSIRNFNKCLKSIDWEQFIINIVAHSLIIQMRIMKKAREKLKNTNAANTTRSNESLTTANYQKLFANAVGMAKTGEKNLIEMFFDLEAEIEKSVCRDCISYNSKEIEDEFLQEMSEFFCYACLPIDTFNCIPLRNLIRVLNDHLSSKNNLTINKNNLIIILKKEIFAHHLIKSSINSVTDPDYINQTILYLSQNQEPSVENFMTTLNYCESLEELNELRIKLEEDISRTRSNDKGGQNDQEIKLRLSSLSFVKRRIDLRMASLVKSANRIPIHNSPSVNNNQGGAFSTTSSDEEYKKFLFHANLNNLDFDTAIKNESIQLCFIEFMGKQNVQNLMSFYLNSEMFRHFAKKELAKCSEESTASPKPNLKETKLAIKDFAKGLINSYLLSAVNFTAMSQDDDEQPVNISNRIYYKKELAKTLENLENENCLNDSLLDELQAKIYLLMKQKYYPEFRSYPEFHKVLLKSDLLLKKTNSLSSPPAVQQNQQQQTAMSPVNQHENDILTSIDEDFDSSSLNEPLFESPDQTKSFFNSTNEDNSEMQAADKVSQSSFEMWPSNFATPNQDVRLTAIITSAGRCNDIKASYAIYIIDVTKQSDSSNKIDFWQTYRRFNDFSDLHLILKRRFPQLNIILPGKSFRSSLNDELIEKRIVELNRYLQIITSQDMFSRHPGLLELMLKFLENKRWESQNTLKKKFGLLLTPMISSVQNIQTTLINAPDNVIGIVKGMSDIVLNETKPIARQTSQMTYSAGEGYGGRGNQSNNKPNPRKLHQFQSSPLMQTSAPSKIQIDEKDVSSIDRTLLNDDDMQSSNLLIRVILLMIDEIFDLKDKNQWLRQPLMAIVKSYMKNIKGDSMNRKIKEQIASYLSEKQIARYIKNFRKRMWPKGYLAIEVVQRSKGTKEITKILARTTLLSYVSDELRHILGNDTTRCGLFDVFDLFQHQTLNKRLLNILTENLLVNFFQNNPTSQQQQQQQPMLINTNTYTYNTNQSQPNSPPIIIGATPSSNAAVLATLNLYLSKSDRVKSEWKLVKTNKLANSATFNSISNLSSILMQQSSPSPLVGPGLSMTNLSNHNIIDDENVNGDGKKGNDQQQSRKNSMSRSKSLFNEIQC